MEFHDVNLKSNLINIRISTEIVANILYLQSALNDHICVHQMLANNNLATNKTDSSASSSNVADGSSLLMRLHRLDIEIGAIGREQRKLFDKLRADIKQVMQQVHQDKQSTKEIVNEHQLTIAVKRQILAGRTDPHLRKIPITVKQFMKAKDLWTTYLGVTLTVNDAAGKNSEQVKKIRSRCIDLTIEDEAVGDSTSGAPSNDSEVEVVEVQPQNAAKEKTEVMQHTDAVKSPHDVSRVMPVELAPIGHDERFTITLTDLRTTDVKATDNDKVVLPPQPNEQIAVVALRGAENLATETVATSIITEKESNETEDANRKDVGKMVTTGSPIAADLAETSDTSLWSHGSNDDSVFVCDESDIEPVPLFRLSTDLKCRVVLPWARLSDVAARLNVSVNELIPQLVGRAHCKDKKLLQKMSAAKFEEISTCLCICHAGQQRKNGKAMAPDGETTTTVTLIKYNSTVRRLLNVRTYVMRI